SGDAAAPAGGAAVVDLGDTALLPGLVDTHVHVNEPGRTEWEGFATATRAAASGGVTTLLDMPLNSLPPTVGPAALAAKRAAAEGACAVDAGFWGGAVPGNLPSLRPGRPAVVATHSRLGRLRVQVLHVRIGRTGVSAAPAGGAAGRVPRGRLVRRARRRPRRGPRLARPSVRRRLRGVPRLPAAGRRAPRRRAGRPAGGGDRRAGPHPARVGRRLPGRPGEGPSGRPFRHRRDVPALPDADGRGRRRPRLQVLPADPRRRQPRGALAGPRLRRPLLRGHRPLALHARAETRRLRHRV